jgi:hypothetical protein
VHSTIFVVDLDRWPVVHLRAPATIDVEVCLEYGRIIEALLARGEEFVVVADNRPATEMDAVARTAMAKWEKAHNDELAVHMKALALVFKSRALYALAGLVAWLNPPPYPKKCFLDVPPAAAWAEQFLSPSARSAARGRKESA